MTPIATEPVQQLAFTGASQLAMANTGPANSTDAQFFITNGVPSTSTQQAFDFNYTPLRPARLRPADADRPLQCGRDVAICHGGENSVADQSGDHQRGHALERQPQRRPPHRHDRGAGGPDGHHHRHGHRPQRQHDGLADIHRHDDCLQRAESPVINFVPFANPVTAATTANAPVTVQLNGTSGFPNSSTPGTLTYRPALPARPRHDQQLQRDQRHAHLHAEHQLPRVPTPSSIR